jgi:PKD repeat protein
LTGYDWDDVKGIIDRANDTIGNRGKFVLDVDPTKGYSTGGYGVGNLWLRNARDILVPRGEEVFFDETRWYVTHQEDVIGYSSWGSNDANDTDRAKPHNTWVNGSIAETFVSTGGRTFTYPPRYGQSMIADIIAENVTGVKGYVYEPYLSAIAHPDTLFERYTAGFNLAESYRMASVYLGWMGVVVGDPKCAPYRDIPDLATDDDLIFPSNATPATGENMFVTVGVKNLGGRVDEANLTLYIDGRPWVVENLTFDGFSLTTLRISFDAPLSVGTFAIKVALNDPLGFFETMYDNNEAFDYITTQERPVITLHVSNPSPMTLDSVSFDIRVVNAPFPLTLFTFDFADGTDRMVLQSNSTFHAFDQDGTYNVTAWVLDENMVTSLKANVTVVVRNRVPLPIITVNPDMRLTGEVFTFNATESTDMDGTVVSAEWDFGDDNTSAGWSVLHSYRWPGEYVVRLTVADDDDAVASVSRRVTVLNRPPVAAFTVNNEEVWKGRTATLNATSSSDPDGRIAQYEWDFGDGTEGEVTWSPLVNHVFETAGIFTVTLTVVDDMGTTATIDGTVEVLNMAPTVDITVKQTEVWTGDTVELDGSGSYDDDGTIVDYEFRVVDESNDEVARFAGSVPTVTWEPEDDGVYRINLLVTDDDGTTVESWTVLTEQPSVTVHNRLPLVLLDEPTHALLGTVVEGPVTLAVGVEVRDLDGEVSSVLWLKGDTTTQLAEGVSVTIPVSQEGPLAIKVLVTDDDGAEAMVWLNLTVNEPPEAAFDVTLDGEDLETVDVHPRRMLSFDGTNSYDPGGIARFQWDFGDGFLQEGMLASHAYEAVGTYTITLKVTDDHGANDEVTFAVTVVEEPSPDVSGLSGSNLALLIGAVVAAVIFASLILMKRLRTEEEEGGEGL